jgi:hypothetical protein
MYRATAQDVNDIIANVIEVGLGLQLEKEKKRITLELNAVKATAMCDELHLTEI